MSVPKKPLATGAPTSITIPVNFLRNLAETKALYNDLISVRGELRGLIDQLSERIRKQRGKSLSKVAEAHQSAKRDELSEKE